MLCWLQAVPRGVCLQASGSEPRLWLHQFRLLWLGLPLSVQTDDTGLLGEPLPAGAETLQTKWPKIKLHTLGLYWILAKVANGERTLFILHFYSHFMTIQISLCYCVHSSIHTRFLTEGRITIQDWGIPVIVDTTKRLCEQFWSSGFCSRTLWWSRDTKIVGKRSDQSHPDMELYRLHANIRNISYFTADTKYSLPLYI